MDFVPVNEPDLSGNERNYLLECVDSGWISSEGPFVERLEEQMAQRVGRRYGIAVCNGSAALEIAVAALKLGSGDEVILPTFTIISCAAAIEEARANVATSEAEVGTAEQRLAVAEQNRCAVQEAHLVGELDAQDLPRGVLLHHPAQRAPEVAVQDETYGDDQTDGDAVTANGRNWGRPSAHICRTTLGLASLSPVMTRMAARHASGI